MSMQSLGVARSGSTSFIGRCVGENVNSLALTGASFAPLLGLRQLSTFTDEFH
jgi:hypothetical protein